MQFEDPAEDEGELGDMKKKYADQLSLIKDIFPEWTDVDLIFALAEADGDVETTIERVSAGTSLEMLFAHVLHAISLSFSYTIPRTIHIYTVAATVAAFDSLHGRVPHAPCAQPHARTHSLPTFTPTIITIVITITHLIDFLLTTTNITHSFPC